MRAGSVGVYSKLSLRSMINICAKIINPLSGNFTKWSNTLKQFVDFCQQIV